MDRVQKLMVSGYICAEGGCPLSVEVRRGMPIFSLEGQEVGKVAAVVLSNGDQQATHLLLGRLPETYGYWMLPVSRVNRVVDGRVHISIDSAAVDALPRWHDI